METTRNKLTTRERRFFDRISEYLDTKIYFYGSIQRYDYFPGYSDIDVYIFTDNVNGTLSKLQNFLSIEPAEIRRFVYKLHNSKNIIKGHKIEYEKDGIKVEFTIYNVSDKEAALNDKKGHDDLPAYTLILLIILKFTYYKLGLITSSLYKNLKNLVLHGDFDHRGDFLNVT
jgi:hypothetical protein